MRNKKTGERISALELTDIEKTQWFLIDEDRMLTTIEKFNTLQELKNYIAAGNATLDCKLYHVKEYDFSVVAEVTQGTEDL